MKDLQIIIEKGEGYLEALSKLHTKKCIEKDSKISFSYPEGLDDKFVKDLIRRRMISEKYDILTCIKFPELKLYYIVLEMDTEEYVLLYYHIKFKLDEISSINKDQFMKKIDEYSFHGLDNRVYSLSRLLDYYYTMRR